MYSNLKMTTILGRSMRIKFFNFRLPLNNHVHHVRPHWLKVKGETYATAAFKHAMNEDSAVGRYAKKLTTQPDSKSDPENVGSALAEIDWIVKDNGRVLMKHVVNAFNMIDGKNMNISVHGLYLLRCCKYMLSEPSSKRIELSNTIWNRLQELGIQMDVRHYNALLEVHIGNNFAFNPSDILSSMEEQHIEPNRATCLLLIGKYCKDGNLSGASEILEYMKEKGFAANEEVFNHLIEGHLKNNDFTGAEDMIEVMNSSNLQLTGDTYALFASAFATCGDSSQMMTYLNGKRTNLFMSNQNYLKVIEALSVSGNHQYIDDVLNLMGNIVENRREVINSAIELIHKGETDIAYKLIISSANAQYNNGTDIFIKQLIKVHTPFSQIIHYCNDIFNKGINNLIFFRSARTALEYGNIDCAFSLFKEMLARGYPIRSTNFSPIFSYIKETQATEDVWVVLEKMGELGVPADFTLYLDHIFPAMGVPKPTDVVQNIQKSGQIAQNAYDALFVYYCNLGELDHALSLTQTVPVSVSQKLDLSSFLNRYQEFSSGDWKKSSRYFKILKYIFENLNSELQISQTATEGLKGKYLAHLILTKSGLFEAFLKSENIGFSKTALAVCEEYLNKRNPASVTFLDKFRIRSLHNKKSIGIEEENSRLNYLIAHKLPCKSFLIERISYHTTVNNIERVTALLSLYEKNGFSYTPFMLAQLFTLYNTVADLKASADVFSKLKNNFPSFKLDSIKIFEYAALLTKYNKLDETLNVLKDCLTEPYVISNKSYTLRNIRRFTAAASETGNIEFVRSVQNLIMPLSKTLESKNVFLEPLISVHLYRKDLASALDEYKSILVNYRLPVCLNNILKKCIITGDKITLQKTIDLTINYAGKNVALLELSVAFIECGYYDKAVTVIQNLDREADPVAIENICMRMCNQSRLLELEQFIRVTKSLAHVDKEKLYFHFLRLCADRNDYKKAVEVFNMLREEVGNPSSEIVDVVLNLLKKNNQPISISGISKSTSEMDASDSSSELSKATENFIKHLEEKNAELVLDELNALKKGYVRSLSSKHFTDLIDLCLENNCLKDLSLNVPAMSYIIDNPKEILTPVLEKYSTTGEVEKLVTIANYFPDFSIKKIGFNTYFSKAFISSGKYENLLSELEERSDKKNKLFSVTAFEELLKFPEFEDRLLKLTQKYHELNFDMPITVVWAHYFIKEDYQKADEIINLYLKHSSFQIDGLINSKILRVIRQTENVSLGQNYVNFLNEVNLRERAKISAYGTLLDLLVLKEKYDDAVTLVLECEKLNLLLHKHFRSTLVTLKSALERENKPVLFCIPNEDF